MAAKPAKEDTGTSTTEYQVWYDAPDGARRSLNAVDTNAVQQIVADIHEDEARRQLLAQSVGLNVGDHAHNFEILKVVTTTTPVEL